MNRNDNYFGQELKEDELDGQFQAAEDDIIQRQADQFEPGIANGFQVTTGPALHQVVISPGVAFDANGRRMASVAPIGQLISADYTGAATAPSGGNYRWITIAIVYGKFLADPRTDALGNTVYFSRIDSFNSIGTSQLDINNALNVAGDGKLCVVAGPQAAIGSPLTFPALPFGGVKICDVLYTAGDTTVPGASIFLGQRQYAARVFRSPIDYPTAGIVTFPRLLVTSVESADMKTRIYSTSQGLEITVNAVWNLGTGKWVADKNDGTRAASRVAITSLGLRLDKKFNANTPTPWNDTIFDPAGWDSVMYVSFGNVADAFARIEADGDVVGNGSFSGYVALWARTTDSTAHVIGTGIQFPRQLLAPPSAISLGPTPLANLNVVPGSPVVFDLTSTGAVLAFVPTGAVPFNSRVQQFYTVIP